MARFIYLRDLVDGKVCCRIPKGSNTYSFVDVSEGGDMSDWMCAYKDKRDKVLRVYISCDKKLIRLFVDAEATEKDGLFGVKGFNKVYNKGVTPDIEFISIDGKAESKKYAVNPKGVADKGVLNQIIKLFGGNVQYDVMVADKKEACPEDVEIRSEDSETVSEDSGIESKDSEIVSGRSEIESGNLENGPDEHSESLSRETAEHKKRVSSDDDVMRALLSELVSVRKHNEALEKHNKSLEDSVSSLSKQMESILNRIDIIESYEKVFKPVDDESEERADMEREIGRLRREQLTSQRQLYEYKVKITELIEKDRTHYIKTAKPGDSFLDTGKRGLVYHQRVELEIINGDWGPDFRFKRYIGIVKPAFDRRNGIVVLVDEYEKFREVTVLGEYGRIDIDDSVYKRLKELYWNIYKDESNRDRFSTSEEKFSKFVHRSGHLLEGRGIDLVDLR